MSEYAIEVENLTKIFYPEQILKRSISDIFKGFLSKKNRQKEVVAISNLNLKIFKGEIIGIIGQNGSGKSTLLKIISGITSPTSGSVKVYGSLLSILEIGTGFHPDLSGRENIYFLGGLHGLVRKEIESIEKEIIDFSELNNFIDIPVKNYSSGMFMRLAFSIVTHFDAEIILLDEVFSVGDYKFKEKSLSKILELKQKEKTILIVSHELNSLFKLCTRFLIFENLKVIDCYEIDSVTNYLTNASREKPINFSKSIEIHNKKYNVFLNNFSSNEIFGELFMEIYSSNNNSDTFNREDEIFISISFVKKLGSLIIPSINLRGLFSGIMDISINPLIFNPEIAKEIIDIEHVFLRCKIPRFCLNNGKFFISLYFVSNMSKTILKFDDIFSFDIEFKDEYLSHYLYDGNFKGCLQPNFKWELNGQKSK